MDHIEITGLPKLYFAHSYEANKYRNEISAVNDRIEISYIYKGTSSILVNDAKYQLKEGDITCNLFNRPFTVDADEYHCHHTVCFFSQWTRMNNSASGLYLPPVVPHSKYDDEIKKSIDSFIYSPHIFEGSSAKTASKFLDLLCLIDEAARASSCHNHPSCSNLILKAKKYIYANIHTPITQREIAEYLSISPEYLCSIFRKNEGVSVIKFINTVKLKNIKTLMVEKHIKLYEAAAIYGYSDPNYVSLLYKKIFGYNITDVPNSFGIKKN